MDKKQQKEFFMKKVRLRDKKVQSVQEVDFGDWALPMIAVYKNPDDYPGYYVARVFNLERPTNVIIVKESLKEIMEDIEEHTDMIFFDQRLDDVSSLVGIYL